MPSGKTMRTDVANSALVFFDDFFPHSWKMERNYPSVLFREQEPSTSVNTASPNRSKGGDYSVEERPQTMVSFVASDLVDQIKLSSPTRSSPSPTNKGVSKVISYYLFADI